MEHGLAGIALSWPIPSLELDCLGPIRVRGDSARTGQEEVGLNRGWGGLYPAESGEAEATIDAGEAMVQPRLAVLSYSVYSELK